MSTVDVGCGIELAVDDADDAGDDELCNKVEEKLEETDLVEEDTLKVDVVDFEGVFEPNVDGEVLLVLKALDDELLLESVWLDGVRVEYGIFLDDSLLVLSLTDDVWPSGDLLKDALVEEDLFDEVLVDEDLLEVLLKEVEVDDGTLIEENLLEIVPRTVLLDLLVVVDAVFVLDFLVEDVFLVLDVFFDEIQVGDRRVVTFVGIEKATKWRGAFELFTDRVARHTRACCTDKAMKLCCLCDCSQSFRLGPYWFCTSDTFACF